jgi:hypothetical protein
LEGPFACRPPKSFHRPPTTPAFSRVTAQSAAATARRAKRVAALAHLGPELEALTQEAKDSGLGLIGYFLDMAIYEIKREQETLANKP